MSPAMMAVLAVLPCHPAVLLLFNVIIGCLGINITITDKTLYVVGFVIKSPYGGVIVISV